MYGVYIVRCADNTYYTGTAKDIDARIRTHNAARGARYTRARLPVVEVYRESLPDRNAALSREAFIKRLSRAEKERLIADTPPEPIPDGDCTIRALTGGETVLVASVAAEADAVTVTRYTVSLRYRGHRIEAEALRLLLGRYENRKIRFAHDGSDAKRIVRRFLSD